MSEKKGIKPVDPETFFPNRFAGNVLLITGAAFGSIGGCTAIRAAREGAKVMCVDIKEAELNQTVSEILKNGGEATALIADIRKPEQAEKAVHETVSKYGKLDLVLNAAGVMDGNDPSKPQDFENTLHLLPSSIHNATDEYWHNVMDANINGIFYCMRSQLNQMLKQDSGGAIVNIGSIAGIIGLPGNAAYSASKHAVTGLTRNAAIDYAPYGIRVNSVNMAQTDTPMVFRAYEFVKWAMEQGMGSGMAGLKSQSLLSANEPEGRGATPWEQAAIILFLLSEDASNITGACYATDGAWTTY
jgi:NAD(P)-dependent dehydrogenase (short-subunit alcohol dehydrogenase family)